MAAPYVAQAILPPGIGAAVATGIQALNAADTVHDVHEFIENRQETGGNQMSVGIPTLNAVNPAYAQNMMTNAGLTPDQVAARDLANRQAVLAQSQAFDQQNTAFNTQVANAAANAKTEREMAAALPSQLATMANQHLQQAQAYGAAANNALANSQNFAKGIV